MTAMKPPFLLAVQMDVRPDHEDLFQDIYDNEHAPNLLQVPGVRSVRRFRRADVLSMAVGGAVHELKFPGEPVFSALYEIDSPDVLTSEAWSRAVDLGRWSSAVRPFTSNRRYTLHQRIMPKK